MTRHRSSRNSADGALPHPFSDLPPIGMGCWAAGGAFRSGDVQLGYANTNDRDSRAALEAAWDAGVRVFDTASVYGAGHSERLVGEVLGARPDAVIVTKFGYAFDERTREMGGERLDPVAIRDTIDGSRRRLGRDRLDVVLLHVNELAEGAAVPVFDTLDALRSEGAIECYGWSTDFPASVERFGARDGFVAVQHAANVLLDAPSMDAAARRHALAQMIRSPLAMGLLGGAYDASRTIAADDVRNHSGGWNDWFQDRRAGPEHTRRIAAVRDLLTVGGRTLAQGALGWLLARTPRAVPVPGARNAAQATENAGALAHGPLPAPIMDEIERVLQRPPEGPPRAR